MMSSITYTTSAEGDTKVYTIDWIIRDYKGFIKNNKIREYRSKSISETDQEDFGFQFKIQFSGRNYDIMEIYYLSQNPVFLSTKFYILGRYNNKYKEITKTYHLLEVNKWQYLTTMMCNNLYEYVLHDDTLNLKFLFTIPDIKLDRSQYLNEVEFSNDFHRLLINDIFSDITIKSSDGKEYRAHKAVLACRSAVLKANFEHNTTECITNIVESPFESEVLHDVLKFMYSNEAPKIDEIPMKLLLAADYYQLYRLKYLCEEALYRKLNLDNAIETLALANLHSADKLKQLTLEFIKDGQAKLITTTKGWHKLESVEIIKQIYKYTMVNNDDTVEYIDITKD